MQAIREEKLKLKNELGWLEEVNDEADGMLKKLRNPALGWRAAGTREQADLWAILLSEWFATTPTPVPEKVHRLFGHFVHDLLAVDVAQRTLTQFTGQNFFDVRGFDLTS